MNVLHGLKALFTSRMTRLLLLGVVVFVAIVWVGWQNEIFHTNNPSIIETTYAAGGASPDEAKAVSNKSNEALIALVDIGNLIMSLLTFIITPLIMLAGWLLSPDWTFGDIFGLREVFHRLWILISNVVYVIFAIILVAIAFMNIVGAGWDTYQIKKMLPKLIVSILIVPFTWFIVSATLSIVNILTASVIQLPVDMLMATPNMQSVLSKPLIPKFIIYDHNNDLSEMEKVAQNSGIDTSWFIKSSEHFASSNCEAGKAACLSLEEFLTNGKGGAYNLLSVYAYAIFKIQDYKSITTGQLKWDMNIWKILNKLSFGLIFFAVFGVLLIAIIYALFSRALVLWLFAMFSPVFALTHFLEWGKMGGKAAEDLKKHFTIGKFISLAMVPVYVSAALAFGLMFLWTVMNGQSNKTDCNLQSENIDLSIKCDPASQVSLFSFGDMQFVTLGLITSENTQGLNGALDVGKWIIGTIIINILALAILWMAVMAALKSDDITGAAVKPISDFGDSIGKLAVKTPQYIPLKIPGTDKSISMQGLGNVTSQVQTALNTKASNEGAAIGKSFAKAFGLEVSELAETLRKTSLAIKSHWDINTQKEDWKNAMGAIGDASTLRSQEAAIQPAFKEMLSATKMDDKKRQELMEILDKKDLPKFIEKMEHFWDSAEWGGNGGLSHVDPKNTDEYLKSVKNQANRVVVSTPVFTDPTKKDNAKVNVEIWKLSIPDVELKVKDGKIENIKEIGDKIKTEGAKQKMTIEKEQIDSIIKEIESKIPTS